MYAYCGSRLDLDLQGWAHLQADGINEELRCPDRRTPLETLRLGAQEAIDVGRCRGCLGLFLHHGRLEALLDQAGGAVWGVAYELITTLTETPRNSAKPWSYRSCPSCGELMNRSLQGRRSGVVVDLCCGHERRQNSPQRELEAAQQRHRQSSPLEGLLRRLARQLL